MARISSIVFNKRERPRRATIITKLGTIKVEWRDVCGDRSWFTSGNLDARKFAADIDGKFMGAFVRATKPGGPASSRQPLAVATATAAPKDACCAPGCCD